MKYLTEMTYKDACRCLNEEKQMGRKPKPADSVLEIARRSILDPLWFKGYSLTVEFSQWAHGSEAKAYSEWSATKAGRVWRESVERERRRLEYRAGFAKHLARLEKRKAAK